MNILPLYKTLRLALKESFGQFLEMFLKSSIKSLIKLLSRVFSRAFSAALSRIFFKIFSIKSKLMLDLVKVILIYVLTILPPVTIASSSNLYAADLPINVDGSTNTAIIESDSGVPIVNIAAPNESGLSRNNFTDYNVNEKGLIINNATNNNAGVVKTDLAGYILDNPHLFGGKAADTILNEVTSLNKTYLNGFTEIAGSRSDLIIANPNGIVINGGGFINIDRLSMVVGSSNYDNINNNLIFNLSDNSYPIDEDGFLPKLTINNLGLDVEDVNKTDLVANIMQIFAPIYAKDNELSIKAGDKEYNYNLDQVTSNQAEEAESTGRQKKMKK